MTFLDKEYLKEELVLQPELNLEDKLTNLMKKSQIVTNMLNLNINDINDVNHTVNMHILIDDLVNILDYILRTVLMSSATTSESEFRKNVKNLIFTPKEITQDELLDLIVPIYLFVKDSHFVSYDESDVAKFIDIPSFIEKAFFEKHYQRVSYIYSELEQNTQYTYNEHVVKFHENRLFNSTVGKNYKTFIDFVKSLINLFNIDDNIDLQIPQYYSLGWFIYHIALLKELTEADPSNFAYKYIFTIVRHMNNLLTKKNDLKSVFKISMSDDNQEFGMNYTKLFTYINYVLQKANISNQRHMTMFFYIKENTFNLPEPIQKHFIFKGNKLEYMNKTLTLKPEKGKFFDNTIPNNIVTSFLGIPNMIKYGRSCTLFSFGYSGTGKTANIFGYEGMTDTSLMESIVQTVKPTKIVINVSEFYGLFTKFFDLNYFRKDGSLQKKEEEIELDQNNIVNQINELVTKIENNRKISNTVRKTTNNPNSSRSFLLFSIKFNIQDQADAVSLDIFDLPGNEDPTLDQNTENWYLYEKKSLELEHIVKQNITLLSSKLNENYTVDLTNTPNPPLPQRINKSIILQPDDNNRFRVDTVQVKDNILYMHQTDNSQTKGSGLSHFKIFKVNLVDGTWSNVWSMMGGELFLDELKSILGKKYKNLETKKAEEEKPNQTQQQQRSTQQQQRSTQNTKKYVYKYEKLTFEFNINTSVNVLNGASVFLLEISAKDFTDPNKFRNDKIRLEKFVSEAKNANNLEKFKEICAKNFKGKDTIDYFLQYAEGEYINYVIKVLSEKIFMNQGADNYDDALIKRIIESISDNKNIINFFIISNYNKNENLIQKYQENVNNYNPNNEQHYTRYNKYITDTQHPILDSFKRHFS